MVMPKYLALLIVLMMSNLRVAFTFTNPRVRTAAAAAAAAGTLPRRGHSSLAAATSTPPSPTDTDSAKGPRSVIDQIGAASLASAAVVAAAAVNQAVSMRELSAPDTAKTFVFRDGAALNRTGKVDEFGLPLVYDKDLIQSYWKSQGSALTERWTQFLGYAVPYLTRVITMLVSGGTPELKRNGAVLAKDARIIFEKLGPT